MVSLSPPTRPSLLMALRDVDDARAWEEFLEIYTPLVFGYCVGKGLQEADAADVSQEVMKAVASSMARFEYDRGRGTFRGWLLTVTRSKLNNHFAARARQPQGNLDTEMMCRLQERPSERDRQDWEADYRRRLFECVAAQVRPEFQERTWLAFWRTAVGLEPVEAVAQALGMSVGGVYIARSRVMARLRERVAAIGEGSDLFEIPS